MKGIIMPVPNPVAFTIFNIDIMWYAVLITSGILLATLISCKRAPLHDMTSDDVLNFVIICVTAHCLLSFSQKLFNITFLVIARHNK